MKTLLIITLVCAVGLLMMAIGLLCIGRIMWEAKGALPKEMIPTKYYIWRALLGVFYGIVAAVMAALAYYGILNVLQIVLCCLVALFLIIVGVFVMRHYHNYILLQEALHRKKG